MMFASEVASMEFLQEGGLRHRGVLKASLQQGRYGDAMYGTRSPYPVFNVPFESPDRARYGLPQK